MLLFVDYMATKHGMHEALNSLIGGPSELYDACSGYTKDAMGMLVDRAVGSGDLKLDMDPIDLLRAIAGVANISAGPNWKAAAYRLVDILIAGLRTSAPAG